jgi:hypothetical protein
MSDFCTLTLGKLKADDFTGPKICKFMSDPYLKIPWIILTSRHGRFSETLWTTLWETQRSQIARILCRTCWSTVKSWDAASVWNLTPCIYTQTNLRTLCSVSQEYNERFHYDMREMEKSSQDGWIVNMIADHCWMLERESTCVERSRKTAKRRKFYSFLWGQL